MPHMRLLPREEKFYHLFRKQVEMISEASRLLLEGVRIGNRAPGRRPPRSRYWSSAGTK